MAVDLILSLFSFIVARQILIFGLNFTRISRKLVWFFARNEPKFYLILSILSLISIVGGLGICYAISIIVLSFLVSVVLDLARSRRLFLSSYIIYLWLYILLFRTGFLGICCSRSNFILLLLVSVILDLANFRILS